MNIEILTKLRDNPIRYHVNRNYENKGVELSEIQHLEQLYNNGNPFPKVLRELLYLAGDFCYVLDYNTHDSQKEMQESMREDLEDDEITITRPFYAVDNYGGVSHYLFIYLDEGLDDPYLYEYSLSGGREGMNDIRPLGYTLSSLINRNVQAVKEGRRF